MTEFPRSSFQRERNYKMDTMPGFTLIQQGAEARISVGTYLGQPAIAKERFVKKYRHPELDSRITKERIKAESKAIIRCKDVGIKTPTLYLVDFSRRTIFMQYFEHSIPVKDIISKASDEMLNKLAFDIGAIIGKMHGNDIIHGDLTTSNVLLVNNNGVAEFDSMDHLSLVFIDFGLAQLEASAEDKGVDFYVLERALLSTHTNAEHLLPVIIKGYESSNRKGFKEVMSKYEEVRARGRKRTMVG